MRSLALSTGSVVAIASSTFAVAVVAVLFAVFLLQLLDHSPGRGAASEGRSSTPSPQAHASATREHGGLGIGLFVTRQLVHALGGRVELTRHPKAGTVAVLHIPDLVQESGQAVTSVS